MPSTCPYFLFSLTTTLLSITSLSRSLARTQVFDFFLLGFADSLCQLPGTTSTFSGMARRWGLVDHSGSENGFHCLRKVSQLGLAVF